MSYSLVARSTSQRGGARRDITISGLGQASSVTTPISSAADLAARLITAPDATLRAQGPQIVRALDTYVVGPVSDAAAARIAPYIIRYIVPPLALLYLMTGLSVFYSYSALSAVTSKKGLQTNPRRSRRVRRRRS
jgi:hypothetical protein